MHAYVSSKKLRNHIVLKMAELYEDEHQPSMIINEFVDNQQQQQFMSPLQETETPPPTIFMLFGCAVQINSHKNVNHDHRPPPPPPPNSIGVNPESDSERMTCSSYHDKRERKACVIGDDDDEEETSSVKYEASVSSSSPPDKRKRKACVIDDGDGDEEETSSEKYEASVSSNSPPERNASSSDPHKATASSSSPPEAPHPNELPENLPKLLFEKRLEESDVRKNQNRLLITGSERLEAALTEEEMRMVESKTDELEVITTDPRGVDFKLRLKNWPSMRVKVLKYEWFKLVAANGIKKGDTVQGWGYRAAGHQFRLAIKVNPNTSPA